MIKQHLTKYGENFCSAYGKLIGYYKDYEMQSYYFNGLRQGVCRQYITDTNYITHTNWRETGEWLISYKCVNNIPVGGWKEYKTKIKTYHIMKEKHYRIYHELTYKSSNTFMFQNSTNGFCFIDYTNKLNKLVYDSSDSDTDTDTDTNTDTDTDTDTDTYTDTDYDSDSDDE